MRKTYPPTKDRRDIGRVEFPIEKVLEARELHSCCIAVEAALEADATQPSPRETFASGWKFWQR